MTIRRELLLAAACALPIETLGWLATHFRDYHPIEPYRTVFDLDADPPVYAADFMDIKG